MWEISLYDVRMKSDIVYHKYCPDWSVAALNSSSCDYGQDRVTCWSKRVNRKYLLSIIKIMLKKTSKVLLKRLIIIPLPIKIEKVW